MTKDSVFSKLLGRGRGLLNEVGAGQSGENRVKSGRGIQRCHRLFFCSFFEDEFQLPLWHD